MNGNVNGISWVLVTPPAAEPVLLAEARDHAKYSQTDNDAALGRFLIAARQAAEDYLGRGLITQTWKLTLPEFYDVMYLPMAAPLQSVTTVKYYDINNTQQTLASTFYDVDITTRPGRLCRASQQVWPAIAPNRLVGRVEITYVVGFGADGTTVPERIKQGIRMYLTYLDADRDGMELAGEQAMKAAESCWTDRVRWIEPSPSYSYGGSYR